MTDWPVKTLGEVALVGAGNSAPQDKELFKGGMHRFVRTSDVGQVRIGRLGESADLLNDAGAEGLREFRAGVTLIPKSGASTFLNHRVQLTKPCFVSSHLAVVDSNPEVMDDTFMFYFLQTVRSQDLIQDQSYPSLNLPAISGINVLVPPLGEQKRIVALLDNATARVTELTACYEQARTNANDLFASALRETLASNPDWPVKTLGEVAVVNPSEPALSEEAPFVPMDAVTAGKRDVQYTQPRGQRSGARARAGDILFARITPCLQNGKVALVQDEVARCGGSTEFIVVRAGSEVLNGYLYQWITSDHIRDEVTALMKGATGRQRLNAEDLALTELPVPPLEQQKRIVARLDAMRAKTSEMVVAYDAKLQAAKNLRQSILESAFEGKL